MKESLQEKIQQLPQSPGVYQFTDAQGDLLYIGKAIRLRSRVQSYFRSSQDLSTAKQLMVQRVADIQIIVVDSETEALLLETTLIKKHKPPYNIVMKDDKNFQYIHITEDLYPQIEVVRSLTVRGSSGRSVRRKGKFFGPYTSGRSVRRLLYLLQSLFHYCETPPVVKRGEVVFPKRPCLAYHLGRCVGPCAQAISAEEYKKIFKQIQQFLAGEYELLEQQLQRDMQQAAQNQQYEKAARFRDDVQALQKLRTEQKVVSPRGENAEYFSLARKNTLAAVNVFRIRAGKLIQQEVFFLQHVLGQTDEEILHAFCDQYRMYTPDFPSIVYLSTETRRGDRRKLLRMGVVNAEHALERQFASFEKRADRREREIHALSSALGLPIECMQRVEVYDISHFQGQYAVGSMIVFTQGESDPSQYRKFTLRQARGGDDFASLQEVLNRRFRHRADSEAWPVPTLIIIDGGKGQLSAAHAVLQAYTLKIPIIGIAKREEELFFPGQSEPMCLPHDSPGLHLVQRMRDEAHRFAIGFYRRRHLQGMTRS